MQSRLNPVLIGGFDVLFLGKKGFSSIAQARKALIRPKGAPKDAKWIEVSFAKKKTKKAKEDFLYKTLLQLTKKADIEAEAAIREEKKRAAKVPEKKKIKFELVDTVDKTIKSTDGIRRDIRKYYFSTDKSYDFVKAKTIKMMDVGRYLKSVKEEFLKEVFSRHGKAPYLIRIYHDYKGLPSTPESDPLDKGFSGMGLNRQVMGRRDVDEQFSILDELYLDNFSRYLVFARSDTYFRFTGFTVEVTMKVLEPDEEKVPEYVKPFVKRRKTKKVKKKSKAKRKPKRKVAKKRRRSR